MTTVIKVENLSKQYRIGAARGGYQPFREPLPTPPKPSSNALKQRLIFSKERGDYYGLYAPYYN